MLKGYQLAIRYKHFENDVTLKSKTFCEQQIRLYAKDVLSSAAFLQCDQEVIEQMLQLDPLECKESELFEGCVAWAKKWCQDNE